MVDSNGIPGWDKVDALARYLTEHTGSGFTVLEERVIKQLFDSLHEYDKRPVQFHMSGSPKKSLKGRWCRSRRDKLGCNVTEDVMRRYVN